MLRTLLSVLLCDYSFTINDTDQDHPNEETHRVSSGSRTQTLHVLSLPLPNFKKYSIIAFFCLDFFSGCLGLSVTTLSNQRLCSLRISHVSKHKMSKSGVYVSATALKQRGPLESKRQIIHIWR